MGQKLHTGVKINPKTMKFSYRILLAAFITPLLSQGAVSLKVSDAQLEIVGATADVTGSGSSSNFTASASVGDYAVFDISDSFNNDFADLKVTYSADNGGVGSNIMIARTTNSQGLTDAGTISILITLGNQAGGTVSLDFEWYNPGSFSGGIEQAGASLITNPINYTTFDIDFSQVVSIPDTGISQYMMDGSTVLTDTVTGGQILFEDNGANSTFDDSTTAVGFLTATGAQSHTISMGKQSQFGNALFMFEFRDPSDNVTFNNPDITPVPEPAATATLVALGALAVTFSRRQRFYRG